ncbi:Long-chain-fatty-acid--CoA ligase FadD13 [Mycobacterium talmoniae]|uniref:Long-chain-fatty-acid--CoA ligase FadD13 n=1 Tax=Mycobacterium talmoniae TaxID=1858794 RepID=A0A2S8BR04_9MYCO|nr:Long-chain-fatty-acid--CoA ligase FadD13 [Mycobacterium talmoniae]
MSEPRPGTPEFWAQSRPDHPAVIHGDTRLTYGQWNDLADRAAEGLAALGLAAGDRIGMRFRLCVEWFVLQRALQKLGVAQVAVNHRLTPDEAGYILRDSGARGLFCNDTDPTGWTRHEVGILVTVGQPAGGCGVRYEDLIATEVPPLASVRRSRHWCCTPRGPPESRAACPRWTPRQCATPSA